MPSEDPRGLEILRASEPRGKRPATMLSVKEELRALVDEAISEAASRGDSVDALRGIAIYDTQKDGKIGSLASYEPAVESILSDPLVQERYGGVNAPRLALMFVYEVGKLLESVDFQEGAFETVWQAFLDELNDPEWVFRGLANMRNFETDEDPIELGEGVSIQGRSLEALPRLGIDQWVLEQVEQDWSEGMGNSSYVMVLEERLRKEPSNFILSSTDTLPIKAQRAIGALRLAKSGDVSISPIWLVRPARFNVGIGGVHRTGWSVPSLFRSVYRFSSGIRPRVTELYQSLRRLEREGYGRAPGNLDLALLSFMATYDRWPTRADGQLLDSVTALEAMLGTGSGEISFRLAFRVAGLLANDDAERTGLFQAVREFYDTRSLIVHGARLSKRHQARLENVDELREIVRRLLRGFIRLALAVPEEYGRKFFERNLEASLLQFHEREQLRSTLGLDEPSMPSSLPDSTPTPMPLYVEHGES